MNLNIASFIHFFFEILDFDFFFIQEVIKCRLKEVNFVILLIQFLVETDFFELRLLS